MITRWTIKNFKKFGHEVQFGLKNFTILSGANSSGKSSLLQSMLLIKQTLMNSSPERALSLNGPLVQLGGFSDIANFKERSDASDMLLAIGWSMETIQGDETGTFEDGELYDLDPLSYSYHFAVSSVHQSRHAISSDMYPSLEECSIEINHQESISDSEAPVSGTLFLQLNRSSGKGRKLKYSSSLFESSNDPTEFRVTKLDEVTEAEAKGSLTSAKFVGASFRNFLPTGLVVRYDRGLQQRKAVEAILQGDRAPFSTTRSTTVPQELINKISEISSTVFDDAEQTRNVEKAREAFRSLSGRVSLHRVSRAISEVHPSTKKRLLEAFASERTDINAILTSSFPSDLVLNRQIPTLLSLAPDLAANFFQFHLHYVGPLRDEPKPIYSSRQIFNSTDVGPRGEYTAAVLSLNEKTTIQYLYPKSSSDGCLTYEKRTGSLLQALADWLKYLGVATDLYVSDRGNLGYELKIRIRQEEDLRDLTNVGVGVSQVLPVLVTVLLAKPGSLTLLEQPELHLHPGVQSKLCDFFLSATAQRKQIIVETHSEHVIERLRLRVAQSQNTETLNNSVIFFFEDTPEIVRKVEINEFGSIEDWPNGFFDESSNQTSDILSASLKKKMASGRKLSQKESRKK